MRSKKRVALSFNVLGGAVFVLLSQGCSSGTSGSFPSITPPLKAATPAGLGGSASVVDLDLKEGFFGAPDGDRAEFRPQLNSFLQNFYTDFFQTGPTVLFNITSGVDNRISFFNGSTKSGCLSASPVAYTITPAGQASPVTMYAQCYTMLTSGFTGDPGLVMIGQNNGITYVWDANGASWTAAMATPDGNSYDIHAWYSVGIGNGIASGAGTCGTVGQWDSCSYGVAEVYSNASTSSFEMTAAGVGVGYCGIQFGSDGTNTYAIGSSGPSCQSNQTACVLSSDESTAASGGICSASSPFKVTTAIGISAFTGPEEGSVAASKYPVSSTNVTLNGTSTDSVHFGPTTVPAGVVQF